jgi:elongation factor Ts
MSETNYRRKTNMTMTPAQAVKELREITGLGMMECKKILEEVGGDFEKAKDLVAKRGQERAAKVAGKAANEGQVFYYQHHDGKLGVLLELNCNTDFVARGDEFRELGRELCLQIAARAPQVVNREDLDQTKVAAIREYQATQVPGNKPKEIVEKIVDGKLKTWFEERVLLDQIYVKDSSLTIRQLLEKKIATIKENIVIARFARFKVGESAKIEGDES